MVWSVCTDRVAELTEVVRRKGATMAPVESQGGEEPLLQRLVDSLKDSRAEKEETKASKVVHLLKNQPPLPSKVVERIRERVFVEFATFPVFDDGPNESGELKMGSGETEERGGQQEEEHEGDPRPSGVEHVLHPVSGGMGLQRTGDVGPVGRLPGSDL